MPQNITMSSKDIVKTALKEISSISAEEALILVDTLDHLFVDLRDGLEQQKTGLIKGAIV